MGSSEAGGTTPPKLSIMLSSRPSRRPEMSTPPLHAAVSVPFEWEEAPGKARQRPEESKGKTARTLDLPPRLVFWEANVASPTTVLEGPYMGRSKSLTSSNRSGSNKDYWKATGFGSCRWTAFMRNREEVEGSSDFSSCAGDGAACSSTTTVRRMSRVGIRRRGTFFGNISHSTSHLWASICDSLRQVVPRRRKQVQDDGHSN